MEKEYPYIVIHQILQQGSIQPSFASPFSKKTIPLKGQSHENGDQIRPWNIGIGSK
jgi:hypothetical protein